MVKMLSWKLKGFLIYLTYKFLLNWVVARAGQIFEKNEMR